MTKSFNQTDPRVTNLLAEINNTARVVTRNVREWELSYYAKQAIKIFPLDHAQSQYEGIIRNYVRDYAQFTNCTISDAVEVVLMEFRMGLCKSLRIPHNEQITNDDFFKQQMAKNSKSGFKLQRLEPQYVRGVIAQHPDKENCVYTAYKSNIVLPSHLGGSLGGGLSNPARHADWLEYQARIEAKKSQSNGSTGKVFNRKNRSQVHKKGKV